MLKIKDMNSNNVIRQGDSQPREYQLDTGNLNLNLTNKSATVRLMTADFQGIGYETTATVSSENKISFSIDDVIPAREYRLEITVDDYVFPSRATDGRFDIDPSSHGQEVNIIQIIGKDEIVREVKEQIEPFLGEVEQAELDRQAQEEARETAEGERQEEYQKYGQQFTDVITELSEEKDYHSLPEIAGARGGFDTLGDRLNETTTQLAQIAYNGKTFGAKGDGETNDSLAISNMLIEAKGQKTYLPAGVYVVDNLIFPPKFDLVLDEGATLKLKDNSTSSAMFNLGSLLKGRVTGGTIDGNKENITNKVHIFVGKVPKGTSLEIDNVKWKNVPFMGTYITDFGGYLGITNCEFRDQGEHRGGNDQSTMIASVMSGQVGAKGLLRFNHNRAYFEGTPRTDGSNPGGVFFAPTTNYLNGEGNFSTFEAIGNYFEGYGQHLANNDISPLHTYPSTSGARFIGNHFKNCGFCAISAKSVQDFVCLGNTVEDGMISTKNTATEGAISYAPGYHSGSVQRPRGIIANNIITNPGGEPNKKQDGIAIMGTPTSYAKNVLISGNVINGAGNGITGDYCEYVTLSNNSIDGSTGGTSGTEGGVRFDHSRGIIKLSDNIVKTKNGHGIYGITGVDQARFILNNNDIIHDHANTYGVILRGVDLVKLSGNTIDVKSGHAIDVRASGAVNTKHLIYDNTNTIINGVEGFQWVGIEKVSGYVKGTGTPIARGVVPAEAGVTYYQTDAKKTWISIGTNSSDWQEINKIDTSVVTNPTIIVGTDAPGSDGTATIQGTDKAGQIIVNVGASPSSSGGGIASIRFEIPKSVAPKGVMLSPANGNALVKSSSVVVYNSTITTTGFSLSAVGNLNANLQYVWYYQVFE